MLLHLPKAFMRESLMPACLADMAAPIMKLWVLKLWGYVLRFWNIALSASLNVGLVRDQLVGSIKIGQVCFHVYLGYGLVPLLGKLDDRFYGSRCVYPVCIDRSVTVSKWFWLATCGAIWLSMAMSNRNRSVKEVLCLGDEAVNLLNLKSPK